MTTALLALAVFLLTFAALAAAGVGRRGAHDEPSVCAGDDPTGAGACALSTASDREPTDCTACLADDACTDRPGSPRAPLSAPP